jgi:hypothetical protein
MGTSRRRMRFMRKPYVDLRDFANSDSGCEPLTPEDIAEVVVFAAGRRENVVLADSLIFPNHQVSNTPFPKIHTLILAGRCYCHAQEIIVLTKFRPELEGPRIRNPKSRNCDLQRCLIEYIII